MTWTVLTHENGKNETDEIAPGRGGYSTVLINEAPEDAVALWEDLFEKDPTEFRPGRYRELEGGQAWSVDECHTGEDARKQCGELELDAGGIGVPKTRYYTWDELRGRLDVWVIESIEDVPNDL